MAQNFDIVPFSLSQLKHTGYKCIEPFSGEPSSRLECTYLAGLWLQLNFFKCIKFVKYSRTKPRTLWTVPRMFKTRSVILIFSHMNQRYMSRILSSILRAFYQYSHYRLSSRPKERCVVSRSVTWGKRA